MVYEIVDFKNYSKEILSPADMAGDYRYCLEFCIIIPGKSGMMNFHEARRWLGDVYGQSEHLNNSRSNFNNPHWTWLVKIDSYRLYLKSDKELMMFKLKFPIGDTVA